MALYTKDYTDKVLAQVVPSFPQLGHSKLADVIHTSGQLVALSHRQLRRLISEFRDNNKIDNKLIIGDLHAPFILDGYLEFCKELYSKYNCNSVLYIGDLIDNHYSSFHTSDPDGLAAGDELYWAKLQLSGWFAAFPKADVMLGNHDLIPARKAKEAGLSKSVLKNFGDWIEAPLDYRFHYDDITINNVVYSHGNVGNAYKKSKEIRSSLVQGHFHSLAGVDYSVSPKDSLYGVQVGCGISKDSYAMAYGKPFAKKPVISAAVVLNNGKLPIVELMSL